MWRIPPSRKYLSYNFALRLQLKISTPQGTAVEPAVILWGKETVKHITGATYEKPAQVQILQALMSHSSDTIGNAILLKYHTTLQIIAINI